MPIADEWRGEVSVFPPLRKGAQGWGTRQRARSCVCEIPAVASGEVLRRVGNS
jgi:hypothetical protein